MLSLVAAAVGGWVLWQRDLAAKAAAEQAQLEQEREQDELRALWAGPFEGWAVGLSGDDAVRCQFEPQAGIPPDGRRAWPATTEDAALLSAIKATAKREQEEQASSDKTVQYRTKSGEMVDAPADYVYELPLGEWPRVVVAPVDPMNPGGEWRVLGWEQ